MVIQHNISAINSYRNLTENSSSLGKNLEKLSSGYKINRAADDAAGLAISESMRSKIAGLAQAKDNANDAIGLIQTADGALTEVHSMLQRMTTLATQAANGTYNTTARANIQSEVSELMEEIDRIATSTSYNGITPLSATADTGDDYQMQIGPTGDEVLNITAKDMRSTSLFDESDYFKKVDGRFTLDLSGDTETSVDHANKAINDINGAINKVSEFRAQMGAKQNRLEHTINNLATTTENMTAAESRIRDTDMAEEIAAYTKNNVLKQASQSMLAQANQAPQGVLSLLQQ